MKYALISDIHGNYPALLAVIEDAKRENIDKYIFVGDYYMCFPYPNQVIDKIKSITNSFVVNGNEEERIGFLLNSDKSTWNDSQFQALYWYFNEISNENKKFLASLPKTIVIDNLIHISHKSSNFIGNIEMDKFSAQKLSIFKDDPNKKEKSLSYIYDSLNDDNFKEKVLCLNDGIYVFGHSHVQWHKIISQKAFINPGSCGFPLDLEGGAPYTILEISNNGEINIDERRINYDENSCVIDLLNSSLYEHEKVWNDIIIKEFKTHSEILADFLAFVENYANSINDVTRPYSKQTWNDAYLTWQNCVLQKS